MKPIIKQNKIQLIEKSYAAYKQLFVNNKIIDRNFNYTSKKCKKIKIQKIDMNFIVLNQTSFNNMAILSFLLKMINIRLIPNNKTFSFFQNFTYIAYS